jgi:hypothetical protein
LLAGAQEKTEQRIKRFSPAIHFNLQHMNFAPLASELIAHQAFHSSPMAQHPVLASDLAAFHDSVKPEMRWKRRSARND